VTTPVIGAGSQPLFVDTAFYSSGASITDLIFDSGNPVAQASSLSVARLSTSTKREPSRRPATVIKSAPATPGTPRHAAQRHRGRCDGAFTVATTSLYEVGLSASPDAGSDPTTIDYGVLVQANGTFRRLPCRRALQSL